MDRISDNIPDTGRVSLHVPFGIHPRLIRSPGTVLAYRDSLQPPGTGAVAGANSWRLSEQ